LGVTNTSNTPWCRVIRLEVPQDVSLICHGVGGNNVILVDPNCNIQLEVQAQDRVYRVGQTKKFTVHRLIADKTIEERITQIQNQKLAMAKVIFDVNSLESSEKVTSKEETLQLLKNLIGFPKPI
jgi:transcription termination factor 2